MQALNLKEFWISTIFRMRRRTVPIVFMDIGRVAGIDKNVRNENMKIWQLVFDVDNYDNLLPAEGCSVEELQSYDGRAHIEEWKPIKVERMYPEKRLELGDAPGFSYFPVFSNKLKLRT